MAITNVGITGTTASAATQVYASVGNNAIATIIVCNTSASSINLTLYAVPSGKTPSANPETTIVSALTIPAGETVSFDQEKMVLANGDQIDAVASVAYSAGQGLVATVSTLAV
jgi:hypothetical protein